MNWHSCAEFFAMGGYGFYVWSSFGMAVVLLSIEPILIKGRYANIRNQLKREAQADQFERDGL